MTENELNIKKMTFSYGNTKTIKYIDKNSKRLLKEVIYTDKDNNQKFDDNEITSVTIFGYSASGQTASSRTYTDLDGDGYRDDNFTVKGYKKDSRGEYVQVAENQIFDDDRKYLENDLKNGITKAAEKLNNYKMQNINENYINIYESFSKNRTLYEELYGDNFKDSMY